MNLLSKKLTRDDVASLLDLENDLIRARYKAWDSGDCSLAGLPKILLFQCALQAAIEDNFYSDWTELFAQIEDVHTGG
jgi:hypothetical protein